MRALVAGGGGFIGGHLVKRLLSEGHSVRVADVKPIHVWHQVHAEAENWSRDLSREDQCRGTMEGIDVVYDLAERMGGIGYISRYKADCSFSVLIGANTLLTARDTGVTRFFFSSSACVYPAAKQCETAMPALKEDDVYPAEPELGYGESKLFMEQLCRFVREDYALQTRVARYHNVYGECFDERTEILTGDGFKRFEDLTDEDVVATRSPGGFIEFQRPVSRQKFHYAGRMLRFKSRSYDLLVTPDHALAICPDREAPPRRARAATVKTNGGGAYMLRHAGWHGTDVAIHQIPGVDFEPSCQFKRRNRNNTMSTIALRRKKSGYQVAMDPWLALLGWYIAEGCTVRPRINRGKPGRGYIVDIRQYDPTNIAEIVRLARACGFRPAVKKEGRVQIYSKVLYSHLSPLGKAGDKHIPAYARQLSTRQLRILFTTMMKGDGSLHEDGSPKCYYTKSRRLADHVSEVAIKLGMGATATLRPGSQAHRKGPVYQVCFSTQRLVHKIQKSNVSYEQYDGFVYDVTVPNHIIMVRRNGRSIWSGNCGDFEGGREKAPAAICRKVIEAKLSGRHEIEIWGDGQATRSFMYIDDCIDGTIRIMDGDYPHPVNLGSSELVTINGLVDIVEEIAGVKLKRTHNLSAPQGVRGRNSDNTLIKRLFDWEPSTPLRVGLERTYAWIYDEMTNPARKHS